MPLSNEDNLRLNVLMAQAVKAIRIDEGKMSVLALTAKGEAKIALNPNEKNERYLKQVQDFLSTKVLDVAGGFPVYLSHWNRMGEAKSSNLGKLLLLGEHEAVIAVVNSTDLTPELASYAWWAYQSSDNARSMLTHPDILGTDISKELAQFLLEFLPFEEDPEKMLMSIRLVLQPGLINEEEKLQLWKKAKSKNTLYIGFMDTLPNDMPEKELAHQRSTEITQALKAAIQVKNPYALKLKHLLSSEGQTFIKTAISSFKRTPNQLVYSALIDSIRRYFSQVENDLNLYDKSLVMTESGQAETDINQVISNCLEQFKADKLTQKLANDQADLEKILKAQFESMLILSNICQVVAYPVFSQSTCVGSLMRKKVKPISDIMIRHLNQFVLF